MTFRTRMPSRETDNRDVAVVLVRTRWWGYEAVDTQLFLEARLVKIWRADVPIVNSGDHERTIAERDN